MTLIELESKEVFMAIWVENISSELILFKTFLLNHWKVYIRGNKMYQEKKAQSTLVKLLIEYVQGLEDKNFLMDNVMKDFGRTMSIMEQDA